MSTQAERKYMADASPVDGSSNSNGRTVPMKVICPAMSRSGTGAMRKALETLGIGRTFHGLRLGERPEDLDIWFDLTERKFTGNSRTALMKPITTKDFDKIIGDCGTLGAVTDMPCAAFWRELMAAYPEAKIVLVERELDVWYRSFDQAVVQGMMSVKGQILANHWVARFIGYRNLETLHRLFLSYFRARNRRELATNAKRIYLEHNEAVRTACRQQGRPLLDYKLGSGWEPLCEFLEVEIPEDVEFPKGNEAQVLVPFIHAAQKELLLRALTKFLRQSAAVAALSGVGWVLWTRPGIVKSWFNRMHLT